MTAFLGLLAFILGALAVLFAVLLAVGATYYFQAKRDLQAAEKEGDRVQRQARKELARFQAIADLEKYRADLENKVNSARALLPKLQKLSEMEQQREQLAQNLANLRALFPKLQTLSEMEKHREQLAQNLANLNRADGELRERISAHEATLANLVAQTQSVEETLDMQSFGFYQPKYGFEDSEHYAHKLTTIRDAQKQLVKSDHATHCPQDWHVDGSAAKGRKMVNEQAKLMLRAFNGESDAAIGNVKYNNVNNLENRLNRSFEAINKLGESKKLWVTRGYLNLKLQELYLVHEHREKVEAEREQQRQIREQMREEEKAEKEIEKAKKDAERDEAVKLSALEKARQELAEAQGKQTDRLQTIVDRLEAELKDALERKVKAIARAQLTRSGHVYVLSNVGSFGKNVYKIGMTRRFEPLERVEELGSASVPFRFDVHAMIYCEDAPSLENMLHKHFDSRRVNLANYRREFFHVTLDEIREAVKNHFGVITFVTVPDAEEYRKTLAIREERARPKESEKPEPVLVAK
jgi:hypothetical protein